VWAHPVLGVLTDAGLLTSDEYSEASAYRIGTEFAETLLDSTSMLAASRLVESSGEKSPAAQIVRIFTFPEDSRTTVCLPQKQGQARGHLPGESAHRD
jgi:hypothetical protein